jgi:hypothetical protein
MAADRDIENTMDSLTEHNEPEYDEPIETDTSEDLKEEPTEQD